MNRFKEGLKAGIPIGIGYFAVAFSMGILAASAGLNPFQGFLASALITASAGENAALIAIREAVPYIQIAMITVVANIRYVLMSFALSQKISPETKMIHRFLLGFWLTDEFFALAIQQEPYCDPFYSYGAALSVAIFGMFLAIIIPPAKKSKPIAILIVLSFLLSYLLSRFSPLSESSVTIVLTITISSFAAIVFPVKGEDNEE